MMTQGSVSFFFFFFKCAAFSPSPFVWKSSNQKAAKDYTEKNLSLFFFIMNKMNE